MKKIGNFQFPETTDEAKAWPNDGGYVMRKRTPHSKVMSVAHTRIEGLWCAYIAPVPGENHDSEWQAVLRNGTKLEEDVARAMFPMFVGIPYAP